MDRYQAAAAYADRIERELRALNAWQSDRPPAGAYESEAAFFADTMTFYQWLQFVLLPRVREIVEQRGQFPGESSVGAYAVRALDGRDADGGLIELLSEFDGFIERKAKA
jgi:uncharacterized protein YqcC (DUF446 family)